MKYFTIKELCTSQTATKLKISNIPTKEVEEHITDLIDNLLDPLREAYGSSITITSGYRTPKLNQEIGGSKTSSHQSGYAADLVPSNGDIKEFKEFAVKWLKDTDIPMDQCILEKNSKGSEWLHLAIKKSNGEQRRQFLEYKNGKYIALK